MAARVLVTLHPDADQKTIDAWPESGRRVDPDTSAGYG